eukprot:6233291-Amphidinium_carterae.1
MADNTSGRPSPSGNCKKGKGKSRGKRKVPPIPPQSEQSNKCNGKNKGKTQTFQCYLRGRCGHTSPNCWWKGKTCIGPTA